MTTFDNREQAFENKFAHEEKMAFALEARICKLFGLWAAEHLGMGEDDALSYARDVITANLEEAGFADILRKVRADFDEKGVDVSNHTMESELERCVAEAKKQHV